MSDRRPLLRELIRTFFADYMRLVEPDSAGQMRLERITFPELPATLDHDLRDHGVVAEVLSRRGETVTVISQIEPEVLPPPDLARRLGRSLMTLELCYGQPVLLSVVFLQGGRSGIRLESGAIAEICDIELARVYYTAFGLSESRAEYYLERPEPLAWALAAWMKPAKRTPEEHLRACLDQIDAAPLDEEKRFLLRRVAEARG